jgi:hypothetical protein
MRSYRDSSSLSSTRPLYQTRENGTRWDGALDRGFETLYATEYRRKTGSYGRKEREMERQFIRGANPYMPLWEHVPDGEPRVFEYGGEKRVYVYGSHDMLRTEYCGTDYVVWSAPVTDLTDWKCHGVCYRAEDNSVLFAPDVVQKGDLFYMYAAEQKGSVIMVARSRTPWGPFTDPVKTELGFDPGILVDDDGRVYAYWGFCASYCAELNEDMATIRPGTLPAPRSRTDGKHSPPEGRCDRKTCGLFCVPDRKRESGVQSFYLRRLTCQTAGSMI